MKKWRLMSLVGILLGIVLEVIDYFVAEIPYMIIIPLQIVAIVMIFGGFIWRNVRLQRKVQ